MGLPLTPILVCTPLCSKLVSTLARYSHPAISPGIKPVELLLPSAPIPSLPLLPFDSLSSAVFNGISVGSRRLDLSLQGQTPSAAANRAAPVLLGVVALDVCGV